jgi:hypothetical protein
MMQAVQIHKLGHFPAWCWGPPYRDWLQTGLYQVPQSTVIGCRVICTWDDASHADAQVQVQVTGASEFQVV